MHDNQQFLQAMGLRNGEVFAAISLGISKKYPDKTIVETENHFFDPHRTGDEWTFSPAQDPELWSQQTVNWWVKNNSRYNEPRLGYFQAEWNGHTFLLVLARVEGAHCPTERWYIIGDLPEAVDGFFAHVCTWHSTVRSEILVFAEGRWQRSQELYEAIKSSHLDDLTLHGDLKDQIVTDITQFLAEEALYERYRIPWKRGILFLGPPGNGKTHLIRAMTNHLQRPCLYVKSFQAQYASSQQCVSAVFERAREVAPCLLILEDLDTLLTEGTRSFFLNEMDGFASNHGIVTIATCNFPEKLDPAITQRPSRFDRKYHFDLPAKEDRRAFIERFQTRFDADLQLDNAGLEKAAEVTEGYSYAYLKELVVSSVVRWVSTDSHRPIIEVISDQAETLLAQMTTEMLTPPPPPEKNEHWDDEDEDDYYD